MTKETFTPNWIPVEKKLPTDYDELYLVTVKCSDGNTYVDEAYFNEIHWCDSLGCYYGDDGYEDEHVIAWAHRIEIQPYIEKGE